MQDELESLIGMRDFIAHCSPFDQLTPERVAALTPEWVTLHLSRGSEFPPKIEPHYWLIRQGTVELRSETGQLLEWLGEGDSYTAACFTQTKPVHQQAHTREATVLYGLPLAALQALWQQQPTLRQTMLADLGQRLAKAHARLLPVTERDLLSLPLKALIRRPPVTVEATTTLQAAAHAMNEQRVSALLVMQDQQLCGVLTDRDLRSRVLAQGLALTTPVHQIMTPKPLTLSPEHSCADALLLMTQQGLHHLPVCEQGVLYGLVSSTDLLHAQTRNSLYLADRIRRAGSVPELIALAHELPELWFTVAKRGDNPVLLGHLVTGIADALTQRLLHLAEQSLGAAPIAYAWIAYGSQGRSELSLHSDQDNALVLADSYQESQHQGYFQRLAAYVCEGLAACGFIHCPGQMMATNPRWCLPVSAWQVQFTDWLAQSDPHKTRLATNLFDFRWLAGSSDLTQPLRAIISQQSHRSSRFMHYLVQNQVAPSPLSFFRQHFLSSLAAPEALDIKSQIILPLVSLARIYALSSASAELNTLARFKAAAAQGRLSASGAQELSHAFELALSLRTRHQLAQFEQGLALTNWVVVTQATAQDRQALRDIFKLIALHQQIVSQLYSQV